MSGEAFPVDLFGYPVQFEELDAINDYFVAVLEYQPFRSWQRILESDDPGGGGSTSASVARQASSALVLALQQDYEISSGAPKIRDVEWTFYDPSGDFQSGGSSGSAAKIAVSQTAFLSPDINEQYTVLAANKHSRRGLLYLKAMEAWQKGELEEAYQIWICVLNECPRDLFAAKRAQLMGLILGNEGHIYGASFKISEHCTAPHSG